MSIEHVISVLQLLAAAIFVNFAIRRMLDNKWFSALVYLMLAAFFGSVFVEGMGG